MAIKLGDRATDTDVDQACWKGKMKKSVLFVINSLTGGGAERVMTTLLAWSELESKDVSIHLALLDDVIDAYPLPSWVIVHRLSSGGRLAASIINLLFVVFLVKPAIIVSFLTRSNVSSVFISLITRTPCIISERVNSTSHFADCLKGRLHLFATGVFYRMADHVVAVSLGVRDVLVTNLGVKPDRISVVYNPIDVEKIRLMSLDVDGDVNLSNYIVTVGRLVENKNFQLVLEALKIALVDYSLVIIGEGALEEQLKLEVSQCGLGDRVVFKGFLPNPFPVMRCAEMFILPSNAEGFPNSLVEALALGLPVISTNCPSGPSEILADLRTEEVKSMTEGPFGILVPPRDATALAAAIERMGSNGVREHYASVSAGRALEFSPILAKDRYWSIIKAVLKRDARG